MAEKGGSGVTYAARKSVRCSEYVRIGGSSRMAWAGEDGAIRDLTRDEHDYLLNCGWESLGRNDPPKSAKPGRGKGTGNASKQATGLAADKAVAQQMSEASAGEGEG